MTPYQWALVLDAGKRVAGNYDGDHHDGSPARVLAAVLNAMSNACMSVGVDEQADEQDEPGTVEGGAPIGTVYSHCSACPPAAKAEVMKYPGAPPWKHADDDLDWIHRARPTFGNTWTKERPARP